MKETLGANKRGGRYRTEFHGLSQRKVKARFDGGKITSDAGILLLREVEKRAGLLVGLDGCFGDHRDPRLIEHTVQELLGQRVYGLCLGYEDMNDHYELRNDPMLSAAVDKADPLGENRWQASDRGRALAGKCMLNRLKLPKIGARIRLTVRNVWIAMPEAYPRAGSSPLPFATCNQSRSAVDSTAGRPPRKLHSLLQSGRGVPPNAPSPTFPPDNPIATVIHTPRISNLPPIHQHEPPHGKSRLPDHTSQFSCSSVTLSVEILLDTQSGV